MAVDVIEIYEACMIVVPNKVIDYFGSTNVPVFYELPKIENENSDLSIILKEMALDIDEKIESDTEIQQLITTMSGFSPEQQRLKLLVHFVQQAIAEKRLKILDEDYKVTQKRPYDHPDLREIPVDPNGLTEFNLFATSIGGLQKGNTVFDTLISIAGATNSMYWVNKIIRDLSKEHPIYVRLDPLLIQPSCDFRPMIYKMWVYGKELNWSEIKNLKETLHMRWQPDLGWQKDVQFTDLVWSPREDGIHFICEEVPTIVASKVRGSRYYHSIYSPTLDSISHCDGAIRIYSNDEIVDRHTSHVRKMGKIGKRIKIFQIDSELPSIAWTTLIKAFFVWNRDIEQYFA